MAVKFNQIMHRKYMFDASKGFYFTPWRNRIGLEGKTFIDLIHWLDDMDYPYDWECFEFNTAYNKHVVVYTCSNGLMGTPAEKEHYYFPTIPSIKEIDFIKLIYGIKNEKEI